MLLHAFYFFLASVKEPLWKLYCIEVSLDDAWSNEDIAEKSRGQM